MKSVGFVLFSFLSLVAFAQDFSIKDVNCQVKINPMNDRLFDDFQSQLKEKGYEPVVMTEGQTINRGELTARFEKVHLDGKLYKDCQITLKVLRLTSHQSEFEADVIVDHTTTRTLPRITFKGHERCSRGLRDAFLHLPACIKP